ncbi:DUF2785 domain-containing protein [Bacillus sp. PS06]|uniref:DUF2785 domain-containing protein n=1 Tax=Bacillus sp. PS06 TaxID=2764176 RepID=UPI00177E0902|nr:DUF2785 domain-containing protein [Bacillus sp. PS06]MBD8070023.1 DUF2785 domain-containing protein [Bacillus sp. PS06]
MSLLVNVVPMNELDLKGILKEIKNSDRHWNGENKYILVQSMLHHIGATDSELRDQLIYGTFFQLIIEQNELEHELLSEILGICISDLLFQGIGESGTDHVFTRAFTTLIIALIIFRDSEDDFLTKDMLNKVKDKLILYMNLEIDLRGYVSKKGWAHSIAHVADAFGQLVHNPKIEQVSYLEILQAIWSKIFISESVYIHDEDERLIMPLLTMLENGLELDHIESLVKEIPKELERQKEQLAEENYWFLLFNCKVFLKSFHFQIKSSSNYVSLKTSIENCLKEM